MLDRAVSVRTGYVDPPQGADFDMGIVTFSGLHSRLGFLPVIPGPCGLFRASAVTHDILHEVRGSRGVANPGPA